MSTPVFDIYGRRRTRYLSKALREELMRAQWVWAPGVRAEDAPPTWADEAGVIRRVPRTTKRLPAGHPLKGFIVRRDVTCRGCGTDDERELAVDHILSASLGGSHHPINLQLLCSSCNATKAGLREVPEHKRRRA